MRLKAPIYRFAIGTIAFSLPLLVFAAMLPALINAEPVKKRFIEELQSWVGTEVRLRGPVTIERFFSFSLNAEKVEFGALPGLNGVKSVSARRVIARIAWLDLFMGRLDFDKIKLEEAVIRVAEIDLPQDGARLQKALAGMFDTPFRAFVLSKAVILIEKQQQVTRQLGLSKLVINLRNSGQIDVVAGIEWKGQRTNVEIELAGPDQWGSRNKQIPALISLRAPFIDADFNGMLKLPGDPKIMGTLAMNVEDSSALRDWLNYARNAPLPEQLDFSGAVDLSFNDIALKAAHLRTEIGSISGDLSMTHDAGKRAMAGSIAINGLDLASCWTYLAQDASTAYAMNKASNLTLDLRVSADRLKWGDQQIGDAAFALSGSANRPLAEIAQLNIHNGIFIGQMEVDFSGAEPQIMTRLTGTDVDMARIAELSGTPDWLEGTADMNIEAFMYGSTSEQLKSNSQLTGKIVFSDGGRIRFDPLGIAQKAKASGRADWSAADLSWQNFNDLRFRTIMSDRQLRFEDIVLTGKDGSVRGLGEVNLVASLQNWQLDIYPGEGLSADEPAAAHDRLIIRGGWQKPNILLGRLSGAVQPAAEAGSDILLTLRDIFTSGGDLAHR